MSPAESTLARQILLHQRVRRRRTAPTTGTSFRQHKHHPTMLLRLQCIMSAFVWIMITAIVSGSTRKFRPHHTSSPRVSHRARFLRSGSAITNNQTVFIEDETHRRLTIQLSTEPIFFCTTCQDKLQAEQDAVTAAVLALLPGAGILSASQKILNALYLLIPKTNHDHDAQIDRHLRRIPGVVRVTAGETYARQTLDDGLASMGVPFVREQYCAATGRNVRIALLDSGVDYTHALLGGPGTAAAYEQAWGTGAASSANTMVDATLFPTNLVVAGYDAVGDVLTSTDQAVLARPDNNPIDSPTGHGTLVAHAIVSVAPNVQLYAVKVCLSTDYTCPDWALIKGMEYALDPNNDGSTDDRVDLVNLSLGRSYTSAYYSQLSFVLENLVQLGVLPIVAAGNAGNVPYIVGGLSTTANALVAGAVRYDGSTTTANAASYRAMAGYSSRGPGENNLIKPDIVSPGGRFLLASPGTGYLTQPVRGTSFAAPITTGAVALIKERCAQCSPLALRALIMNNADRDVVTEAFGDRLAPISWAGAGALNVGKALNATTWAYSAFDMQPSLSLGLVDAAHDAMLTRTIKIVNLNDAAKVLRLWTLFRDEMDGASGAMTISFSQDAVTFDGDTCGEEKEVDVIFRIKAANCPPNFMTQGGLAGLTPDGLDINEFDGWIIMADEWDNNRDISLPFHAVLRQAASVQLDSTTISELEGGGGIRRIGLTNNGTGVAQIDGFELVALNQDDPEYGEGEDNPPSDIRYVGYRTLQVDDAGDDDGLGSNCGYLIEFAVQTWERVRTPQDRAIEILIDANSDGYSDLSIMAAGFLVGSPANSCRVYNSAMDEYTCTGFPIDHATNTAVTIVRACSNALGVAKGTFKAQVKTHSYPSIENVSDATASLDLTFPLPRLSLESFDVPRHASVDQLKVQIHQSGYKGLLLVTNSYRRPQSTGAATFQTEGLALAASGFSLPAEQTPDGYQMPRVTVATGPGCDWQDSGLTCDTSTSTSYDLANNNVRVRGRRLFGAGESQKFQNDVDNTMQQKFDVNADGSCPEVPVPRSPVQTLAPLMAPITLPPGSSPEPAVSTPTPTSPEDPAQSLVSSAASWGTTSALIITFGVLICLIKTPMISL